MARRRYFAATTRRCDDEENVIPRLYQILKSCIGWEISRIGDLGGDL
jgi:hypothetical protein